MTHKMIIAVYDAGAEAYGVPYVTDTKGTALRSFMDAIQDENSQIARHKGHYSIFKIGEYDQQTGTLFPCNPELWGNAWELAGKANA